MYKYYAKLLALWFSPLMVKMGVAKLFSLFTGQVGYVLMLHRVVPPKEGERIHNHLSLEITPEKLESFIAYFLKHKYAIISFDQVKEYTKAKRKYVVFTFDDGYKDNFTHAYPIFKKYNLPFTIYVCNDFPNSRAFLWWYLLEELLLNNSQISITGKNFQMSKSLLSEKEKEAAFYEIRKAVNSGVLTLSELKSVFENYKIKIEKQENWMLTWEEIISLSKDPIVTIGSHTITHRALKSLAYEEAEKEIVESKKELEEKTGRKINHFAYPFGSRGEVGGRDVEIVKSLGFDTATTTVLGGIKKGNLNELCQLPRITINAQTSLNVLKVQISGFFSLIDNGFKGTLVKK